MNNLQKLDEITRRCAHLLKQDEIEFLATVVRNMELAQRVQLAEDLKQFDLAASPAPWKMVDGDIQDKNGRDVVYAYPNEGGGLSREEDGKLIIALRNSLPEIIAALTK